METDRTEIAKASADVAYLIGYLRSIDLGAPWTSGYRTDVLDVLWRASREIEAGLYPHPKLTVVRDEETHLLGFERTSLDGPNDPTLR